MEPTKPRVDIGPPRYVHDCYVVGGLASEEGGMVGLDEEACTFVGRHEKYDLYIHTRPHTVEAVARFSDEGGDYISGPMATRLIGTFLNS